MRNQRVRFAELKQTILYKPNLMSVAIVKMDAQSFSVLLR